MLGPRWTKRRVSADLALGDDAWINMINRDGALVPVRGDTILQAGDEVLLLADPDTGTDPQSLFTLRQPQPSHPPTPFRPAESCFTHCGLPTPVVPSARLHADRRARC
jgi:hypothetical protein